VADSLSNIKNIVRSVARRVAIEIAIFGYPSRAQKKRRVGSTLAICYRRRGERRMAISLEEIIN